MRKPLTGTSGGLGYLENQDQCSDFAVLDEITVKCPDGYATLTADADMPGRYYSFACATILFADGKRGAGCVASGIIVVK